MVRGIRGMRDILPDDTPLYRRVEETFIRVARAFSYEEIRVPCLERTELFVRSVGPGTDIVAKELYTFDGSDGSSISLRPEGTAGVMRACIEKGLSGPGRSRRFYYVGPMFRHERPQKGRARQFYQLGVENIGSSSPLSDVEIILLLQNLLKGLGFSDQETRLELNSIGCRDCRIRFREDLLAFLEGAKSSLCPDCLRRSKHNPLRVFDCKREECLNLLKDAPPPLNYLCPSCLEHFEGVRSLLAAAGITFSVNPRLVRGLDYYTGTVFEQRSSLLGAQDALAGGGRYDHLMEDFGGLPTPATGFAAGTDRIILLLKDRKRPEERAYSPDSLYIAYQAGTTGVMERGVQVMRFLALKGFRIEMDILGGSLKSQMKRAGKSGCKWTVILGEEEIKKGTITLRDMESGTQRELDLESIPSLLEGEHYV